MQATAACAQTLLRDAAIFWVYRLILFKQLFTYKLMLCMCANKTTADIKLATRDSLLTKL